MLRKIACLLFFCALFAACASSPRSSARRELRLDTETASSIRHAATASGATGSLAPATTGVVVSSLVRLAPFLVTLLEHDNKVNELGERLEECARQAERQVNARYFGSRAPTREECSEQLEVDGCGKPITRAMLLGRQKHAVALQCAQEVLEQLWPAPFSIEQRYRYYPNAKFVETVSREEEARLIAQDCTGELWRTIKPDIVLHADRSSLRKSVLTLDFKFPCPNTNRPQWTRYGDSSAYARYTQLHIYREALGGDALMISPQTGIIP